MILGQSGTGKTTSLRNIDPSHALLIKAVPKPLPFRAAAWQTISKDNPSGSAFATDLSNQIIAAMRKTEREIIIIDDFQYVLANEFMRRSEERSFDKFTDIAKNAWNILTAASALSENKRVYIMSHTQEDEHGNVKAKTIGRLLDEKITVEGLLTIVLRTKVVNGQYLFATHNSGSDTVKSPLGMFPEDQIPNDLDAVDSVICEFYGIQKS